MEHKNAIPTCQFKIHIICGWQKYNIRIMIINPHNLWVAKMYYLHYDSNSHHLWEAKMQNQYVKHETFLMQIDDLLKSIQG
jgi:hypothetical protein